MDPMQKTKRLNDRPHRERGIFAVKGAIPLCFISMTLVTFFMVPSVPSSASETGKEPLPVKALADCLPRPNCVSSLAADEAHQMPPIRFTGPVEAAQEQLRRVIKLMPRSVIIKDEPGYIAVIFRSKVFGFVDEAQFLFDEKGGAINFRSGARSGYYDFGVNRSRLEKIRESFALLNRAGDMVVK